MTRDYLFSCVVFRHVFNVSDLHDRFESLFFRDHLRNVNVDVGKTVADFVDFAVSDCENGVNAVNLDPFVERNELVNRSAVDFYCAEKFRFNIFTDVESLVKIIFNEIFQRICIRFYRNIKP